MIIMHERKLSAETINQAWINSNKYRVIGEEEKLIRIQQ